MAGFDREQARTNLDVPDDYLDVPDDYNVEAMIAVGHPGEIEERPEELRPREFPSGLNPVEAFSCEGPYAI